MRLTPDISRIDKKAPEVAIEYPQRLQHEVWREDAVIARVFDASGIRSISLLVDGESHLPDFRPQEHLGYIVLPLLAKNIEPGKHDISLRVTDKSGNTTETKAVSIYIPNSAPAQVGKYHRALHLLNRLAYGPEPEQLAKILLQGEDQWLKDSLQTNFNIRANIATREISTFPRLPDNNYWVARKALTQATVSPNPVRERFNFWVQNHFSTWINKTQAEQKWREHLTFYQAGFEPFGNLLRISAHSPAMLVYLDQQRSFARKINENYAREIMELHTLSVDGRYSQKDVTTLSRVLTGWMTSQEAYPDGRKGNAKMHEFQFEVLLNDPKPANVIGLKLPQADRKAAAYDRIETVLEALGRHPDTAHFIAQKFAAHYVPSPAPTKLVADLEQTFHRTGGNMASMMQALVKHEQFWASIHEEKLATPQDYSIRIARIMNHYETGSYHGYLQRSGMGMFGKSTPDGYPEEPQAYTDSNVMLQRWHLAKEIAHPLYNRVNRFWKVGNDPNKNGMKLAELTAYKITGFAMDENAEAAVRRLIDTTDAKNLWSPGLCALMLQLPQTQYR